MKALKIQFLIVLMLIAGGWLQAQTTTVGPWTFYPTNSGGTMQGQAQINGFVAADEDVIAAFEPSGECVGAASLTWYSNIAYINFVIYGDDGSGHGMNAGENFTLKLRDSSAHVTYTWSQTLAGWQNTQFAPMPGYDNPNTVYNFVSASTLSVTPSNKNVTCSSGTTTFAVTSNTTWTVTDNASWLAVSPTSGSNNATLTATFSANTTGVLRVATITITGAGVTTPVTVTVSQCPTVTPTNQNVTCAAGTTSFTVNANSTWTVSESVSWLSVSPASGTNNGTLTVTYDANTGAARTGTISVTFPDLPAVSVTVTQAAVCTLTVTPANQTVTNPAGTTTFTITTTCAWTVSESVSWLSVSPTSGTGNGTITVTYDANTGAQRVGTITVSVPCATSVPVTVTQGGCTLSVTPANQNVTCAAGTTTFSITSACAWTVTESTSWLSVSPTSGTGNGTITVTYDANSTGASRTSGSIVVTVPGVTPYGVTVTQSPCCTVTVTPANQNVTATAGTTTFSVITTPTATAWTVADNATWLAVSPSSGTGNATITATYSANNTGASRTAIITVTGCETKTVTVTQAGTRTITVASQNPASGVPITVSPADNSGNTNGTTQFTRVYNDATNVTLTAPATASGNAFQKWQKNSVDFSTNTAITFSTTANDTYTAVYSGDDVTVTLPDTCAESPYELPIYVSNVTGKEIISFQFTLTFNSAFFVPADPFIITTGTLSSAWTVNANPNTPGQIIIGGFGATALSGAGVLLKVKFNWVGATGPQTAINVSSFIFNAGTPSVTLDNGSWDLMICGDADDNGIVQAYDAALILQHAIGLINLTGCLLIDVNGDGQVTAYDAALVLQHVLGLPLPPGTYCFDAKNGYTAPLPDKYEFRAKLINALQSGTTTSADIVLGGIIETGKVYSVSFDLTSPTANIQNLTMPNLPSGYVMFINPTDGHTYSVGIINTNGVLTNDMKMHILLSGFNNGSELTMSNISLNDHDMPDIKLAGNTNSDNPITGSLVAYPNPFNSATNITYQVTEDSPVQLEIFDMFGRSVKTLVSENLNKGFHNVTWNGDSNTGTQLKQGWYIVRLKASGSYEQIKINLMY